MNHKGLILVVAISGLLLLALVMGSGDLAWMALPFLVYLGVGVLQAPTAGSIRLKARRSLKLSPGEQDSTIEVSVRLDNLGKAIGRLCISDQLQPGMFLTDGKLEQAAALEEGGQISLRYAFRSRRGHFAWKTVGVVVSDPLGLVETSLDLPAEAEVEVQPGLQKFRPFPLHPQSTLHSAGSIPARLGGSGTDFWGIREYHPGDPLRRLAWSRTARHPGKFFTKEFQQEEIADIGLVLDARRKTDLKSGEDSLFEHSTRAAASLAELFLRQGNRLSLLIYGGSDKAIFPGYGKVQLYRILHALSQVETEADASFDSLQNLPLQMFSSSSLIVILSPLAANDWLVFPRLRAHGFQVVLISPDPLDYARRMLPTDTLTNLSSHLAGLERSLEISKITRLWIPVIDWKVSQPLAPLVRNALSRPHIQRQR